MLLQVLIIDNEQRWLGNVRLHIMFQPHLSTNFDPVVNQLKKR